MRVTDKPNASKALMIILFIITVAYMTFVFAVAQSAREDTDNLLYQNSIDACERNQAARREFNFNTKLLRNDANNLVKLTETIAATRRKEVRAFTAIGKEFKIEKQVAPLIEALHDAAVRDSEIAKSQREVIYPLLALPDCKQTVRKP